MFSMTSPAPCGLSHLHRLRTGLTRAAEQLSSQQVPVVLQEGQVKVPEELHVFVLHSELLWRVPVDHLKPQRQSFHYRTLSFFFFLSDIKMILETQNVTREFLFTI